MVICNENFFHHTNKCDKYVKKGQFWAIFFLFPAKYKFFEGKNF